jgi:hypothetical protein
MFRKLAQEEIPRRQRWGISLGLGDWPLQWRGPAFLNEVWDLSWKKAEKDLQYEPMDVSTALEGQFMSALRDCLNKVKKESS